MVVDGEEAVAAVAVDDVTLNVGVLDEIDEIVEDELGADVGGDEEDGGDEIDELNCLLACFCDQVHFRTMHSQRTSHSQC